jgi:hypothetical protein
MCLFDMIVIFTMHAVPCALIRLPRQARFHFDSLTKLGHLPCRNSEVGLPQLLIPCFYGR